MTKTNLDPGSSRDTNELSRKFEMTKVYVKDMSFESPNAPNVFESQKTPAIDLRVNVSANARDADMHEVMLRITLTATSEGSTVFLIELEQAALFLIRGYSDEQRMKLLETACPAAMFPFARESIWSIIGKGGFPGLLLRTLEFDSMMAMAVE